MKKIFSILALLLMAVTGAWADGTTYTVQFKANGNTKTIENVTLPRTFWCNYSTNNGEIDQIIKELYELSQGGSCCCPWSSVSSPGIASVTVGKSGNNHYITISAPFEGTATVSGEYMDLRKENEFTYSLDISILVNDPPTTYSVTLAEGTEDAANWTADPNPAEEGQTVTIKYNGTKKVKSIKAVKKAAAAAARTLAEATADDLGKIVGADGNIYDTKDDAETAGTTAVAMIAYVNGTEGLAIALADESGKMNWSTAMNTCEGKTEVTNAAWVLPSQNQWKAMFKANGDNENSYSGLNTALATAGGNSLQEDGYYWSSTEIGDGLAWRVYLDGGDADWYHGDKGLGYRVRACLAFTCGEPAPAARTLADATADDLGKIAGADGKIYDTKDDAEAASTTAVAMIAYVGADTDHDTYKHGLAIALSDESNSNWSTAKNTCENKTPAVTGAAWVLPSQNQWKAMFKANGDNENSYSGLNTALATAGGNGLQEDVDYWSSTENDDDFAWYVHLFEGDASWDVGYKDVDLRVRACLAF